MNTEGIERSELRKLQKEQERERRRLRDRQRRQSMSVEEREIHLARRRRNYQLRRLRAENSKLDSDQTQSEQMNATSQPLALPSCFSNADVGPHPVFSQSEGLEVPAHKLAKISGKLRLNDIKRLARSINVPVGDNQRVTVDATIKGNEDDGLSSKGLRLNHVKHLARSLQSAVKETKGQNHPSQAEG